MMKKYVLLAVLLCTAVNVTFALEFSDGDGVSFSLYFRTLGDSNDVEVCGWSGDYNLTEITIPATVTHGGSNYTVKAIGEVAFRFIADPWREKSLKRIVLPETIESIGARAFYNCNALESLTIPEAVKTIGAEAFVGCPFSSIVIPNNVESIGHNAFQDCKNLCSVVLSSKITILDLGLFYNCILLESVNIPVGVTEIRSRAFYGCKKLSLITLPKGLSVIGGYAFEGCTLLTSIRIPSKVTDIASGAFKDCHAIMKVEALATSPCDLANDAFSDEVYQSATLIVPASSKELYQQKNYWNRFQSISYMEWVTLNKDVVTFASDSKLNFSNSVTGLKAYVVSAVNNGKAVLTEVTGAVPVCTGLILKGTAGETYVIPCVTGAVVGMTNKLVGVTTETEIGDNDLDYILKDGKFVKAESGYISAGKAYLKLDVALARDIVDIELDATDVSTCFTNRGKMNGEMYNLNGQRVDKPKRGVYIVGGKKFILN